MTGAGRLRVLLVGAGAMGSRHGRVIGGSGRSELAAVVDPAEERGRGVAERFGARWAPEAGDFSGVDAVVVASPTDRHRRTALDALSAGLPLFVEKPLSGSLHGSREIVEAATASGVPLMCGFIERYNPAVIEALARTGSPLAVRAQRLSPYAPRMHAGVAWDLLVHDVDLTLRLFGEETSKVRQAVTGHLGGGERAGEDRVSAELEFSDARTASLSANRRAAHRVRKLTITERDRTLTADLLNPTVTVRAHRTDPRTPPGDTPAPGGEVLERLVCSGHREPLAAQWDRFLDLADGRADPHAEIRSILPGHETVAAILEAAAAAGAGPGEEPVSRRT